MITRLFLGVLGVVSAAVAISAATHAIDIADSTIEDGDARFVIAAVAAAVFLGCVALLVRNLRRARLGAATDGLEPLAPATPPANRTISVVRPTAPAPAPSPLSDRLPGASDARAEAAAAASSRPIFAPSKTAGPPSDADGLFEPRTDQRTAPFASPVAEPTTPEPAPAAAPVVAEPTISEPAPAPPASAAVPPLEPSPSTPPVARPLTLDAYSADDIDRTVDEQRNAAVDGLVRTGNLTTDGPLTADDIRTMLFIALSTEQLRAMLHDARTDDLPIWVEADDDPPTTGHLYVTGG